MHDAYHRSIRENSGGCDRLSNRSIRFCYVDDIDTDQGRLCADFWLRGHTTEAVDTIGFIFSSERSGPPPKSPPCSRTDTVGSHNVLLLGSVDNFFLAAVPRPRVSMLPSKSAVTTDSGTIVRTLGLEALAEWLVLQRLCAGHKEFQENLKKKNYF